MVTHWSAVPTYKFFKLGTKIGVIVLEKLKNKKYSKLKKYLPPTAGFGAGLAIGLTTHDYIGVSKIGLKFITDMPFFYEISEILAVDLFQVENQLGKWILENGNRFTITEVTPAIKITSGLVIVDSIINSTLQSWLSGDEIHREIARAILDEFRFSSWSDLIDSLWNN